MRSVSLILIPSPHLHRKCKFNPFPTPSSVANLRGAQFVHVHAKVNYLVFLFWLGLPQYSLIAWTTWISLHEKPFFCCKGRLIHETRVSSFSFCLLHISKYVFISFAQWHQTGHYSAGGKMWLQNALVYQWTKLVNTASTVIYFTAKDPTDLMLNCPCDTCVKKLVAVQIVGGRLQFFI